MNSPDPRAPFRHLLNDAIASPALADRILHALSVHNVPRNTYLQQVADDPGGMWCLAEGALSVEFAPGMRDPQTSYLLLPPVWMGEGSIIANTPRTVGLSTTRKSVLLHLPAQGFYRIAHDEPLIWRWVANVSKQNFDRAMGMVDALMVHRSEARVAAVLTQLGGRLGHPSSAPRVLDISQAQLAAIVNMSRTGLSPILKVLESKGVIELGFGKITVTNPAALLSLSG